MLFTEGIFYVFLAVVLLAYWATGNNKARKRILLIASYFFYSFWDWRFLGLILFSTAVDYLLAGKIHRAENPTHARRLLMISLVFNLSVLGFFKYYNFFATSFADLAVALGWQVDAPTLAIVLPIGISFYTFQSLSYTLDVYRKELVPADNLLDFALCIAFFPHLVAGPIIRAADILKQLDRPRTRQHLDVLWSCNLFLIGFFKKACVADNLAPLADAFFDHPGRYGAADAWLGVAAYTGQIYCDFSGYSDMAIAVAGLFGYTLRTNFAAPYLAANITDFWRRWHTSLSTWLRDYLYIPLGGGRDGIAKTYRNLMVTMLLGGLWHGASWNFVIWGGMHGTALVLHKEWVRRVPAKTPALVAWSLTLAWVMLAWVPFRARGLHETRAALAALLGQGTGLHKLVAHHAWAWAVILGGLLAVQAVRRISPEKARAGQLAWWQWGVAYGTCWALALASRRIGYVPFVYFQF